MELILTLYQLNLKEIHYDPIADWYYHGGCDSLFFVFPCNMLLAQYTYSAGPAPTCDLLNCTFLGYPEPYDRTTIGIGEDVELNIGNYSDIDIASDGYSSWNVYDNIMGQVDWSLQGPGELSAPHGSGVNYYAPLVSYDTTVTITATIHDSGQPNTGHDPPITKSINFDILIPRGTEPHWAYDLPYDDKGNTYIGGASVFQVRILPDTVNFCNVPFQEDIYEQNPPWPDGIHRVSRPAAMLPISVDADYIFDLDRDSPNVYTDTISTAWWDTIDYLDNGDGYQDFICDIYIPLEFWDDIESIWIPFETADHIRIYSGDTKSCQIECDGNFGFDIGEPMGPYWP
jgi:hypothetical protein